jgi:hypothetical protein
VVRWLSGFWISCDLWISLVVLYRPHSVARSWLALLGLYTSGASWWWSCEGCEC